MNDTRVKLTISAVDKASKIVNRINKRLGGLGRTGRLLSETFGNLGNFGSRFTTLLGGVASGGTIASLVRWQDRLTRLGIQAGQAADKIDALQREIFETARAADIRVDPGEITSAIEQIVEKTGDLKFAEKNIRNIGLAIQATGATGQDIGAIMAEFQKMGVIDPKRVMEALDVLNVQGKAGAFTLQNLARLGPRVVTAYTAMGRGGVQAIREMGAALQIIRQGTGSSEMAATAFEALMRTLGDAKKIKLLQKGGIQIFDPKALKKGKQVLRPINELMIDIIKRTGGKKTILSRIFDAEAIRAFNAAAGEFQRTGRIGSLEKFYSVQADGTITIKDSARAAKTASAAMRALYTSFELFANEHLAGPILRVADALDRIKPETVDKIFKGLAVGAIGMGALAIGGKVFRGAQLVSRFLGRLPYLRKGGGGVAGGKKGRGFLGGVSGTPVPVFVVNSGALASVFGRSAGKLLKLGGLKKWLPKSAAFLGRWLPRAAGLLRFVGPVGMAVSSAYLLNKGMGYLLEKQTGGKYRGDGALIRWIYDRIHPQTGSKKIAVGGNIRLQIESDRRVRVKELKTDNPAVNIDVDAGLVMVGG